MSSVSDAAVARLRAIIDRPTLPERYEVFDVIGRGGMGVVWKAADRLLGRDVAVKVIASQLTDTEINARLAREARILARLEHPGIVPVYDVGTLDDGRGWYVMRLVAGKDLQTAAPAITSRGELLRIVEQLCGIVAYAHAHGIVHRDLKPGNVMLGPFGEVLVLDWGIARELAGPRHAATGDAKRSTSAADDVVTGSGAVLGTPGYMSPEQARGQEADERADVFGLGAILRDLLRLHPDRIPRPLAAIERRATALDAGKRYGTPLELRDDIRRFLDGARVHAHQENALEAVARITRVYRAPILLIAAYVIMRMAFVWWRRA
ncbi:MAG: serine/threonine-protein kinase [Gemmatimonadota bacterium]